MIDLTSPLRRLHDSFGEDLVAHVNKALKTSDGWHPGTVGEFTLSEPILRELLAQAWEEGYEARERDEKREKEHDEAPVKSGCDCLVPTENPYEAS